MDGFGFGQRLFAILLRGFGKRRISADFGAWDALSGAKCLPNRDHPPA
jgi:hypothetical protein